MIISCLLCNLFLIVPTQSHENHIWAARMLVYEAGWTNEVEHRALLHTSKRRWLRTCKGRPFHNFLKAYSTGLAPPWETNKRRKWIRQLEWSDKKPKNFPKNLNWKKHAKWWQQIRITVSNFLTGKSLDPCNAKTTHWAAPRIKRPDLVQVYCGETKNKFYRSRF